MEKQNSDEERNAVEKKQQFHTEYTGIMFNNVLYV